MTVSRRPMFWVVVFLILLTAACADDLEVSSIDSDETVVLFPTFARRQAEDWVIPVHAWVFEPESDSVNRGAALNGLRHSLGLEKDEDSHSVFDQRARLFLVDNERGEKLLVDIAGKAYRISGETGSEGHVKSELHVPASVIERFADHGVLTYQLILPARDQRTFQGVAYLVEPTGLTVISDVDDTVKISHVTDKQALLRKTFFEAFKVVPGMAERFQAWAGQGAAFVFVSSSPWQLQSEIRAMLDGAGFPPYTLSLKLFRIKDSRFFDLFADPFESKVGRIESIIAGHPERHYILVGDSGEKDPEVYGEIYRRHPGRIMGIYIRNVTTDQLGNDRLSKAFENVPIERLTLLDP